MVARISRLNEFTFYIVGLAVYFLNMQYVYTILVTYVRNSQINVFLLARCELPWDKTLGRMVPHDPMT